MKRDLKINYGILDDIIDELNTYKKALQTMENALVDISALVKINEGKSIEAWDEHVRTSKDEIKRYQEQVGDLHSLFKNYVSDTTAYISPLSRDTMMRVSRNNIWVNLQQINIGYTGNVTNALITSHKPPNSFLFGLLDKPSDAEVEASNFNRKQMGNIQENIQHTQRKLENKMEVLWDLYNSKVKPFENTDDAYKKLASTVKKKYTGFFEGLVEKDTAFYQVQVDILRGFADSVIGMVTGLVTIAGDVGIVGLSAIIPDPIEPELIKTKADETFEGYKEIAIQLIQNPMSMLELAAQSVSDTVETEGIAYLTGNALTVLIPASFGIKAVKGGAGIKGPGKAKVDKSPYSKEFIQGKIDTALAGLGNVKVPVFYKEKLSTGPSDITSVGVEMKSLSEVQPQMFKGKGVGVEVKGTKGTVKGVPEINPKYATAIDDKVTIKEQVVLPSWLKNTYTDGQYRTVITNESIMVYRTFGGRAGVDGAFATTVPAPNRITSKIDSALLPEWKNSRQYEAVIEIPKGTELNIGKVEQQMTQTGTVFKGGGDQILLPQNWPNEWIKEIREVPSR
ncbi:hypothetical protein SPD48_04740 [Pseudogracilibacillus sp. SE30717A]|uniref:hypothetical protein n=1 Tax=Pseudogracilibacillus sp. SE30717A TaxID=3098293 RepID=UPI00300E3513